LKVIQLGAISTGIVIVVGVVMVLPAFTQENAPPELATMLFFSVNDGDDLSVWCAELSTMLEKRGIAATVFVPGHVAYAHPQCVTAFSGNDRIDIGSQTYNYANLASLTDYVQALQEVQKGKQVIDKVGDIDSRLFRAPSGSVDQNIYSMLSRSGILADFSYFDHYNRYYNEQFIRYNVTSYDGALHAPEFFFALDKADQPIIINFNSSTSVSQIDGFLSKITAGNPDSYDLKFSNASDVTQTALTLRRGQA
jgi:peptidoglycan/xylan/chitin deacetylase (PgdA/CDA1 family)